MTKRFALPRPGTCRVCGCTHHQPCLEGCAWADRAQTLCSACEGTPTDLAYHTRWVTRLLRRGRGSSKLVRQAWEISTAALRRFNRRQAEDAKQGAR